MPIVAMPDGTQVQFPDDMSRDEIRAMIEKKFPETDPKMGGQAYQFARGAVQGAVFDPVEGIGQLIEHARGKKIPIPEGVRNWFDKVRERTEATSTGTAGRVTGTVGSLLVAPEATLSGKIAGMVGRTPSALATAARTAARGGAPMGTAEKLAAWSKYAQRAGKPSLQLTADEKLAAEAGQFPPTRLGRIARQASTGAITAAAQPVEGSDDDFWAQKAGQALLGGSLAGFAGSPLGSVAMRAARHHPFLTAGAMFHPATHFPTLAILSGLAAQRGLEKAGERVAAPMGAAVGRALSGSPEETEDGKTE